MKILILLCQILLLLNMSNAENNKFTQNDFKVVVDFVSQLQKPLNIHLTSLCWNSRYLIELKKLFYVNSFYTVQQRNATKQEFMDSEQTLYFADLNCQKEVEETLTNANSTELFAAPNTWILLNLTSTSSSAVNFDLNSLYFPVSSRIYIISKTLREDFNIRSEYSLLHRKHNLMNQVAIYEKGRLSYSISLSDAQHRRNLQNVPMNCTCLITNNRTLNHQLDGRERHIDAIYKFVYPEILHIFDYVNVTPTIKYTASWGYLQADGKYNPSVLKNYQDETSEIAAATMFVLPERLPYIQSYQKLETSGAFVFRPPPLSSVKNIFMLPFSLFVWLACIVVLVVFFLVFYIITYVEQCYPNVHQEGNTNISHTPNKVSDLLHLDISIICQQGMESEPKSLGGRMATFMMLLSTLFLFIAYSAKIVIFMQSTSNEINTLEIFVTSKIKVGIEDVSWTRYFFKVATEPIMQTFYKEKIAPPGQPTVFMTPAEGVKRMRKELFAIHAERSVVYKLMQDEFLESEKCGIEELAYFVAKPYQGCRRKSPYKEIFGSAYRKLDEHGIANREFRRIYLRKPQCTGSSAIFLSISMMDTYAVYLIFGTGIALCLTVFTLEHIHFYKKHNNWFTKLMKNNI